MSHVAERFDELLDHRRVEGDTVNNAVVTALALAFADVFEPLGLIAFGDDEAGIEPLQVLRDPSVAPLTMLRHAALYTGAVPLPGRNATETDEEYLTRARAAAVYPLGIKRGTYEAVRRAVEPLLTGTQTVIVADVVDDPYRIYVRTLPAETPVPAAVAATIAGDFVSGGARGALRAELGLTYVVSDSPAWAETTLAWNAVAPTVTWNTATSEDV